MGGYTDLDGFRVDTYNYSDPQELQNGQKPLRHSILIFNIVGEVWIRKYLTNGHNGKDSPISQIQNYNSNLPSVMDFTLLDALGKYSMKMMAAGTRND
jgi:hypothetical protein